MYNPPAKTPAEHIVDTWRTMINSEVCRQVGTPIHHAGPPDRIAARNPDTFKSFAHACAKGSDYWALCGRFVGVVRADHEVRSLAYAAQQAKERAEHAAAEEAVATILKKPGAA